MTTCSRVLVLALIGSLGSLGAIGCGPAYRTVYAPPLDGRVRAVWDSHGEMVVDSAGLVLTAECGAALRAITGHARMPVEGGAIDLPLAFVASVVPGGQVWQPVYYGTPPGPAVAGGPVVSVHPLVFWSPTFAGSNPARGRAGAVYGVPTGRGMVAASGGRGGGRGGGGGGGGDGRGVAIAAVIAALTLPFIDIGVAAAQPISATRAAVVTDLVGTWNDLARIQGTPCSAVGPQAVGYP